ncbi:hypothetical protein FSARC_10686 [Fusarium sarcochroum]|uniref:Uncharacterized protein n=1 Tax=Fusarium sarcochroum TaxID=1208366 RepID=A0A8H4X340_9HYPO|nr:hypothetical protein FSARC_10686 [Fusarium sarcochroum]
MEQRLQSSTFSEQECYDAVQGHSLPLNLGNDVVRLCVISGIRHHLSFALSPGISELCLVEGQEVFARARNARLIMSGILPSHEQMKGRHLQPYCIWYPDVASEDTYQRLFLRFPDLKYQVGRACAVGDYNQLYQELGLLPDISIAEEARGVPGDPGSSEIFRQIMNAPVRYNIMHDYTREIDMGAEPGAQLNGDTITIAALAHRQKYEEDFPLHQYFNITEDGAIDNETIRLDSAKLTEDETALFNSPLPFNLPTMHKDLLILMAAYEGNVDRYVRLRRPFKISREFACLVRGIYHSTTMANYLSSNPHAVESLKLHQSEVRIFQRAINARKIMNNSIFHLIDSDFDVPTDELPYWIWYPTIPSSYTLVRIAEAKPTMRPQCARASIAAGYKGAYLNIMNMGAPDKPLPVDYFLMMEASQCPEQNFFLPDLERRKTEQGLGFLPMVEDDYWKETLPWRTGDPSSTELPGYLLDGGISLHSGQDGGMYEGLGVDAGSVLLFLSSSKEERARAYRCPGHVLLLEDHTLQ